MIARPVLASFAVTAVAAGLLIGAPATANAAAPPAFTWSAPEVLSFEGDASRLTTATSGNGGATVAYQQFVSAAAGNAIYAHLWAGDAWGSANLLSRPGVNSVGPVTSMNVSNDSCAMWQEIQSGTFSVRCASDGRWDAAIDDLLTPDLPGGTYDIAVSDNGQAVAVFAANQQFAPDRYAQDIFASIRSVDGLWSAPVQIGVLPEFVSATDLSVESLSDGTFAAVWRGVGDAVTASVYSPFTNSWGPAVRLFDEGFISDLTLLGGGGAITLVWVREDPIFAVRNFRSMNFTELGWSPAVTVANSEGDIVNDLSLVANSDGGFALAYLAGDKPAAPINMVVVPTTGDAAIEGTVSPDSRQFWDMNLGVTDEGNYVVVLDRGRMQEGTRGRGLYGMPVSAVDGVIEAGPMSAPITPLTNTPFNEVATVAVGVGISVLSARGGRLSTTVGTPRIVPDAPTRLRGNSTRPGVIRLAWRPPVQGADEYQVQVRGSAGGWTNVRTTVAPKTKYRGDRGAAYRFRVRAVLDGVTSPWSDVVRVRAQR